METGEEIEMRSREERVRELSVAAGVSPILAGLLMQRGVLDAAQAASFFSPSLDELHDPYLFKDMRAAVERVDRALKQGEKVLIYGDYDVDGTTAVALVYKALSRLSGNAKEQLAYYVPDRYTEGYGISERGVRYASENGYKLVIALDCGIKAVERMELARELGVDFIICDHHNPGEVIPAVVACLNSKRSDCEYPDKNLSGCGVGFKLMQALYAHNGRDFSELKSLLDLVAVSIASDIVPVIGENRILAYHGLRHLNEAPCVGLRSIMQTAGLTVGSVDMSDVVFKVGPRINAAGRMGSAADAVRLLLSETEAEAEELGRQINDTNDERKDLDRVVTQQATERIESQPEWRRRHSTVLYDPTWSKGVIGIVASRLTEMFHRPTVILTRSQANPEFATGSARSIDEFDLYRAIDSCSNLLENFGGHTYAAGLTMKTGNVETFAEAFDYVVSQSLTEEQKEIMTAALAAYDSGAGVGSEVQVFRKVETDAELRLKDISYQLLDELRKMEPFGTMNTKPVFVTRGVYDYSTSKSFGKMRQHIKLDMIDAEDRTVRSGVAFGFGHYAERISSGEPFDIYYTIDDVEFRGRKQLTLMIKDIRFAAESGADGEGE
ncbi:MAG: single-stranded-DNA-specific exonuclease RecJ [Bacteroidales bacterium]|nr:single-stranded-DNA-specific exonuclease RecJ [Bacteroidales bacterium]